MSCDEFEILVLFRKYTPEGKVEIAGCSRTSSDETGMRWKYDKIMRDFGLRKDQMFDAKEDVK